MSELKTKRLTGKRIMSIIIDISAIFLIYASIDALFAFSVFPVSAYILPVFFLYYFISYAIWGTTLSKTLLSVQLIDNKGKKASLMKCFVHEFVKCVLIGLFILLYQWMWVWKTPVPFIILCAVIIIALLVLMKYNIVVWELLSYTRLEYKTPTSGKPAALSCITLMSVITLAFFSTKSMMNTDNSDDSKLLNKMLYFYNFPPKHRVGKYLQYIETNKRPAKDIVFEMFEKYDIVVLCERAHQEVTQWDFIFDIVQDERFEKIGNIFTEYGNSFEQALMDSYLEADFSTQEEKDRATANVMYNGINDIWPLWDNRNFYDFLGNLHGLNASLRGKGKKINLFFTGAPADWNSITFEKWEELNTYRDSLMADVVINNFTRMISQQERPKCLVIMNFYHAFIARKDNPANDALTKSTASYIYRAFPEQTGNILLNTVAIQPMGIKSSWTVAPQLFIIAPIQHGKWDAAFNYTQDSSFGFYFSDENPFGNDAFDLVNLSHYTCMKYKDVFNAFIYYLPLDKHYREIGYPYMLEGTDEILQRIKIIGGNESYESLKKYLSSFNNQTTIKNPMYYGIFINLIRIGLFLTSGFFVLAFCITFIVKLTLHTRKKI